MQIGDSAINSTNLKFCFLTHAFMVVGMLTSVHRPNISFYESPHLHVAGLE
jgi:hypothetical protein